MTSPADPELPVDFSSTASSLLILNTTSPEYNMSALTVDLTAPNGTKITLPTGLFINNEFVKATSGSTITAINPR